MKFSLIICTFKRAKPLLELLNSVQGQSCYPDEILIVDGSPDTETAEMLEIVLFKNLSYHKVPPEHLGLTKQRNYGIARVQEASEVVCFLDDDTKLEPMYFKEILNTFQDQTVVGVGGVAVNENKWQIKRAFVDYDNNKYYEFENYVYPESSRNVLRNKLGLSSDVGPGCMPTFSHGRTCGFPLTDKTYEVDLLIGMSFSFRKKALAETLFSTYFEGYGLYEDADFSLRIQKRGRLVVNTKAQLAHYHNPSGRPNQYEYGKMVVRNGWYVWRIKYPNPNVVSQFKWHTITLLLMLIRFGNGVTTSKRKASLTEALGRLVGWIMVVFKL